MDKLLALVDGVPTDPKKWGPVVWRNLHYIAIDIKDAAEIPFFIKMLRNICSHIPCPTCKKHAAMFLAEHPPEGYMGTIASNCFKYTVDFHNHANKITGAPIVSYEDARKTWSDSHSNVACIEGTPGCSPAMPPIRRMPSIPAPHVHLHQGPQGPAPQVYAPQVTMIQDLIEHKPIVKVGDLINIPKPSRKGKSRPPEEIRVPHFDEDESAGRIKIITKR